MLPGFLASSLEVKRLMHSEPVRGMQVRVYSAIVSHGAVDLLDPPLAAQSQPAGYHLNVRAYARSTGQALVERQEGKIETLGQRHVQSIVEAHVRTQRPRAA
jgi:hypothetical protein